MQIYEPCMSVLGSSVPHLRLLYLDHSFYHFHCSPPLSLTFLSLAILRVFSRLAIIIFSNEKSFNRPAISMRRETNFGPAGQEKPIHETERSQKRNSRTVR